MTQEYYAQKCVELRSILISRGVDWLPLVKGKPRTVAGLAECMQILNMEEINTQAEVSLIELEKSEAEVRQIINTAISNDLDW